jgi:hypothetical protein
MAFNPISIREAMIKIRDKDWVLPITQRPYVWGDRTGYQKAIYKLFDSLYRNYPIGAFLIWRTSEEIPYREFLQDFDPESQHHLGPVERGNWSKLKCLVYDGQQRLQTLYSCLQYKFWDKVLSFDLLFEPDKNGKDSYGFVFSPANSQIEPRYLRLNTLYQDYNREGKDGLTTFRKNQIKLLSDLSDDQITITEKNIDKLWKLFNDEENRICGYFEIPHNLRSDVQEIFVRLNTGGIPPSQADLVFSLIHVEFYDFQERVQEIVADIQTGTGIELETYDILQLIYFIKYNTPRVVSERIKSSEIKEFQEILDNTIEPLKAFYKRFLHDEFQINNVSIYRSQIALLPLLLYFYKNQFRDLSKLEHNDIEKIKQYFILSQINDWSLQGIISEAARLINEKDYFPLDEIKSYVSKTTRAINLTEQSLSLIPIFTLKLLIPKKSYTYIKSRGRLNPELEHIFPRNPKESDLPNNYSEKVTSLWNLQLGVPGDINGSSGKGNKMPNVYFKVRIDVLNKHYDFLPTDNIEDPIWDYHKIDDFLAKRKELMMSELIKLYNLKIDS